MPSLRSLLRCEPKAVCPQPHGVRDGAAPDWLARMAAGAARERQRLHDEVASIRNRWHLLTNQRGRKWKAAEDGQHVVAMLRSATFVTPYVVVFVLPGSVILLPLLAWFLDSRRRVVAERSAGTRDFS